MKNKKLIILFTSLVTVIAIVVFYKSELNAKKKKELDLVKISNKNKVIDKKYDEDGNPNWSKYYFTGEIELNKYPQLKCSQILLADGSKGNPKVIFNIYDNKIFTQCYTESGLSVNKVKNGTYEFVTINNVKLSFISNDGKLNNFELSNIENLENENQLLIQNDSCEIAKFITKFELTYNSKSIINQDTRNVKIYRIGELIDKNKKYLKKENGYNFNYWLLYLLKYNNQLMSVIGTSENEEKYNIKDKTCMKKILTKEKYLAEGLINKDCKSNITNNYIEVKNCLVTKYEGSEF